MIDPKLLNSNLGEILLFCVLTGHKDTVDFILVSDLVLTACCFYILIFKTECLNVILCATKDIHCFLIASILLLGCDSVCGGKV